MNKAPVISLAELEPLTPEYLDRLEARMLGCSQVEVPVTHTFCAGLYIREGTMPAGNLFLGHSHKEEHHCVVLSGRMTIFNEDRTMEEIAGPCSFIGKPGRKLVYIHEDVTMQNVHSTAGWPDELFNDVDAMEEHLYAKTPGARAARLKNSPAKILT